LLYFLSETGFYQNFCITEASVVSYVKLL